MTVFSLVKRPNIDGGGGPVRVFGSARISTRMSTNSMSTFRTIRHRGRGDRRCRRRMQGFRRSRCRGRLRPITLQGSSIISPGNNSSLWFLEIHHQERRKRRGGSRSGKKQNWGRPRRKVAVPELGLVFPWGSTFLSTDGCLWWFEIHLDRSGGRHESKGFWVHEDHRRQLTAKRFSA